MVKTETVLILGAGASMPFGMPSGWQLVQKVLTLLTPGGRTPQYIELMAEFNEITLNSFREALFRSGRTSVDAFLEHRTEFLEVGKACISTVLLPCERDIFLFGDRSPEKHWYQYLFTKLTAPFKAFGENALAIVTFNYDRTLEQYLLTCLQNSYGESGERAAAQLRRIPIIHVYGQLGALPRLSDGTACEVPFGADPVGIFRQHATQALRLIHDRELSTKPLEAAVELLERCKRVCFLGFSYDATNMNRLELSKFGQKVVCGSTVGMTDGECERLYAYLDGKRFKRVPAEEDSLDTLRHYCALD